MRPPTQRRSSISSASATGIGYSYSSRAPPAAGPLTVSQA